MDLEKALNNLNILRMKIEKAYELCKKIDPLLPEGWRSYMIDDGLWFNGNKGGKNAFKKVCSLITQATGCEIIRETKLLHDNKEFAYLMGIGTYDYLRIYIDQDDTTDCNFEIKKRRKTIYEISGDCLGNKNESQ